MKYKVIKDFASLEAGDVLTEINDKFEFKYADKYSRRAATLSKDFVEDYADRGYLEEVNEDSSSTLDKVEQFINEKIDQYNEDHANITKQYNEKKIPLCVKVEADTVYYNINKVLNAIKDIINE